MSLFQVSRCTAYTCTHTLSQHAKNVGNNSSSFLTYDLQGSSVASGSLYFASESTLQVKAETCAWQEKRRCSFLWPFLAARKGTLFQQAGVWCGQGNASYPLSKALSGQPKGQQHQQLAMWARLVAQVGQPAQDVHAQENLIGGRQTGGQTAPADEDWGGTLLGHWGPWARGPLRPSRREMPQRPWCDSEPDVSN